MKLIKSIFINGKPMGLVREHVWLDLSTPGRAEFTVRSAESLTGVVQFAIGDAGSGLDPVEFFTGFIAGSHTVDGSQQRIFCRELSSVLWGIIPVSIRNASFTDILGVYSRKTGLSFAIPDRPYATTPCPAFQTVASGVHGLDSLGAVFGIKNYIWQQQGDGKVYAGSWDDSRWAGKPFSIPEQFFQDVQLDGAKTMQALPGLRPGVMLNGMYISSLQFKEHFMVVTCVTQLNGSL